MQALSEIPQEDYDALLEQLIEKKKTGYSGKKYEIKNKVARFLISKGFEAELVWEKLNDD